MQDLNDFAWFVQVVDHGGFAAAGRALDQPKSKLSRRIAQLEERLGVRLIQRTTRQFAVTEVGQTFYQHCKAMLIEAEAAQQAVETLRAEPRGSVRITCPVTLLHVHIGPMLARFMARYPGVTLHLEATNRRVDVVGEGIDVAIRVRPRPIEDSDLVMRVLADRGHRLVADDAVEPRKVSNRQIMGTAPENIRHFIELRGIGIVNVARVFGVGAVKLSESLDLVVQLEAWDPTKNYQRTGLENEYYDILGVSIPSTSIPVSPGRNLAVVLETAAINNRQKKMGYNAARELLIRLGLDDKLD